MSSHQAAIHYEPSLRMELRPGFRCCGIPNPHGISHCPSCGSEALPSTFHEADQVVLTLPFKARIYLGIGTALARLANWLRRTFT